MDYGIIVEKSCKFVSHFLWEPCLRPVSHKGYTVLDLCHIKAPTPIRWVFGRTVAFSGDDLRIIGCVDRSSAF